LRVIENRLLKRTFRAKREEVTEVWRKLRVENFITVLFVKYN
jgi:hypothetical protein